VGAADHKTVLAAYDDGVASIDALSRVIEDWSRPTPCDQWNAADMVGHLLAIARYYHRLLDAADSGAPLRGLPRGDRLRDMNAADLSELPETSGKGRAEAFVASARRYRARLAESDWDAVLGEWDGVGERTIAGHTGLAVVEWHVHAWDLARSAGRDHRPADPATVAAGYRLPDEPVGCEGDPWTNILLAACRKPGEVRAS